MVIKQFYSTLLDTNFSKKSDAQKAEDRYVAEYFKELDRQAEVKRNRMKILQQKVTSTV